jgi:hypothetical protein
MPVSVPVPSATMRQEPRNDRSPQELDAAGRPVRQIELCDRHAAAVVTRERGRGLEILDRRDWRQKKAISAFSATVYFADLRLFGGVLGVTPSSRNRSNSFESPRSVCISIGASDATPFRNTRRSPMSTAYLRRLFTERFSAASPGFPIPRPMLTTLEAIKSRCDGLLRTCAQTTVS